MYSRIQRFIANLLLFCILLQSCGGNEFYLYREQRQEITAQLKQTRFSTQCNQEQENSTRETPPPGKWIEPTRKFCCPEIAARSYSLTASPKEINTPAPDKASAPSAPAANPSSLSRFSSFFSSLFYQKETVSSSIPEPPIKDGKEATARVGDFMQQWKNPKVDRELLKQQGLNLLQQVEAHKKQLKASYRRAEVAFITTDIDPAAWKLYQAQQNTKKQELSEVRNLREQLITTLQPHSKELTASKIRLTEVPADVPKKQEAATTYSSDEDLQQASDETIRSTRAFVEGVGKALQGQAKNLANALLDPLGTVEGFVELLASLPELPEMLADCLEQLMDEEEPAVQAQQLGNLLTEAILFVTPTPKVSITPGIAKKLGEAARRVVSKGLKTQWGWSGTKVWKDLVGRVKQGGTIEKLLGKIPTETEARKLIEEAGVKTLRMELPHRAPNPHNYTHINYTTTSGTKGTIRIQ